MPSSALDIRPRIPADSVEIARLAREAFDEYSNAAEHSVHSMIVHPGSSVLVATRERRAVGFVILSGPRAGAARIDAIAVTMNARGRGVGQALLARAEAQARRLGALRIELATADANVAALALFLRSGFVMRRRQARYYQRGQDAVLMEKRLGPQRLGR